MNYIDRIAEDIGCLVPGCDRELLRFYALLLLAKGDDVQREDVHNAWAAWTSLRQPTHPSLVPYDELTPEVQELDQPYVDAIRSAWRNWFLSVAAGDER